MVPVLLLAGLLSVDLLLSSIKDPPLEVRRATAVRVKSKDHHYSELISYLIGITRDGEAIYSGVQDHSRLFANDALIYFLADRRPATRFVQMDPGIANTESGQSEIRAALEVERVRVLVLLDMKSKENNLSSKSNGIEILDRFIDERYQEVGQFGPYKVMDVRGLPQSKFASQDVVYEGLSGSARSGAVGQARR